MYCEQPHGKCPAFHAETAVPEKGAAQVQESGRASQQVGVEGEEHLQGALRVGCLRVAGVPGLAVQQAQASRQLGELRDHRGQADGHRSQPAG